MIQVQTKKLLASSGASKDAFNLYERVGSFLSTLLDLLQLKKDCKMDYIIIIVFGKGFLCQIFCSHAEDDEKKGVNPQNKKEATVEPQNR